MATVQAIITDALLEIGVIAANESPDAATTQTALRYFQRQIDSWAADQLTLSVQSRLSISWPGSTSSRTIGPAGADITAQRPMWIEQLNYVVPGSSPAVEVSIGPMDRDSYAQQSIKALTSQYPLAFFYQTAIDTVLGSITLWPVPNQSLTLYLYAPQAVTVPVTISDVLLGPAGYQEAFLYQLAIRLLSPFGKNPQDVPMLPGMAAEAYARMKRPNNDPSLLGVDAALVPSTGGAYNILTDVGTAYNG